MRDALIVVDMQNDFIDGVLGTKEAISIVPGVVEAVKNFKGIVLFTRDTHSSSYMSTEEGKNLPVPHCIKGTTGWEIRDEIKPYITTPPIDKETFGSSELITRLQELNRKEEIKTVTLIGLCTDICVISSAIIAKASLPNAHIRVVSSLTAGVSPESHERALRAMESCQIEIIKELKDESCSC